MTCIHRTRGSSQVSWLSNQAFLHSEVFFLLWTLPYVQTCVMYISSLVLRPLGTRPASTYRTIVTVHTVYSHNVVQNSFRGALLYMISCRQRLREGREKEKEDGKKKKEGNGGGVGVWEGGKKRERKEGKEREKGEREKGERERRERKEGEKGERERSKRKERERGGRERREEKRRKEEILNNVNLV